jgi:hypothetical protein
MARRIVSQAERLTHCCPACCGLGKTEHVEEGGLDITYHIQLCDTCWGAGRVTEKRMRKYWNDTPATA